MDINKLKIWICLDCKHEILAAREPSAIRWTDGHICGNFAENPFPLAPVMKRLEHLEECLSKHRDQENHDAGI